MNMMRKIFRKSRKPYKLLVVSGILPYLKLSCDILARSQLDNGSWSNDILATSLAIQALESFLNVVGKDSSVRNKIKLGAEFLQNSVNSMSDKILQAENLYGGLYKIAIDFGNAIYTLWLTKSLRDGDFLQKTRPAFLKIEDNVTRFISALNNVEVTCNVLNCHMISAFPPPPEPILDFAISQLFSADTSPKDAFLLIITLKNLEEKFSSLINGKWNFHVSRRTDKWRNMPLSEGLKKLMIEKTEEMLNDEKTDIVSLSYCLIAIKQLNINVSDVLKRTIEKLLNLSNKINVLEGQIPVQDLSLFVCAISKSPISYVAFFPDKESGYVINALEWFERMRSNKIKMLKSYQFNLLVAFVLILTFLTTLLSYLALSDPRVTFTILSLLLSAFYFLVNWLSRRTNMV